MFIFCQALPRCCGQAARLELLIGELTEKAALQQQQQPQPQQPLQPQPSVGVGMMVAAAPPFAAAGGVVPGFSPAVPLTATTVTPFGLVVGPGPVNGAAIPIGGGGSVGASLSPAPSAPVSSVAAPAVWGAAMPGGRHRIKSASEMLTEAQERRQRLELAIRGPPTCKVRPGNWRV